jgi:dihydroceramidase
MTTDPMQLVDELSMIYTTCLMNFATFSYGKSRLYSTVLGICLTSLSVFITLYYHYLQDPTFHQNAYAILTAVVLFRAMYVMEVNIRPRFRSQEREAANPRVRGSAKAVRQEEDRRDMDILSTMWKMIAFGLSIFLGGFAIWHLDNEYCSKLIRWRREAGMPWGFVLEGHGWWYVPTLKAFQAMKTHICRHLMTGLGAYFYIVWGIWLRHCLNYRQDEYELHWPNVRTIPEVIRRKGAKKEL